LCLSSLLPVPLHSLLFPYTTLFRSPGSYAGRLVLPPDVTGSDRPGDLVPERHLSDSRDAPYGVVPPAGDHAKEHRSHKRNRHSYLSGRRTEGRTLVLRPPEVHGGDDPEGVDEGDDARQDADDGQPQEPGLDS